LNFQPTLKQAAQIGADSFQTVIRFSTNCTTFAEDGTIPFMGGFGNIIDGAINIFNAVEVGFKR